MKIKQLASLLVFSILIMLNSIAAKSSQYCNKTIDCMEFNFCTLPEAKCTHKTILPFAVEEAFGLILILFGSALSNAGGIGGGGLLIPILLLIFKFYTHEAIPISKLMIFTGALTSFVLGFNQSHPYRNAVSIDFNIPYLIVPCLLFGTMVGVSLNKVLPPWIILVSLTLVLIINTYKTLDKAKKLYKKENEEIRLRGDKERAAFAGDGNSKDNIDFKYEKQVDDVVSSENNFNLKNGKKRTVESKHAEFSINNNNNTKIDITKSSGISIGLGEADKQILIMQEEKKDLRKFPFEKISLMLFSYVFMLLISLLKGSEHFNSIINVKSCSLNYWVIYLVYLPFAIIITYYISNKIIREYNYRKAIGFKYSDQDIKWDSNSICTKFPLYGFLSGILAGLLGIGGGLILGPLLLELGLHPVVSTATTNFLVLFTSSSTSIQFILLGMMNFEYGLACTIASSLGSFIGTILIQRILQKTKRNSYLIYVLGIVLGISTLLIPTQTFYDLIHDIENKKNIWSFNTPC